MVNKTETCTRENMEEKCTQPEITAQHYKFNKKTFCLSAEPVTVKNIILSNFKINNCAKFP